MPQTSRLNVLNESVFAINQYQNCNADDNSEQINKLHKILKLALKDELNDKQRDILIKYYYEGLSMKEIAEHYNINRATVHRYISRSIKILQHALKYTLPLFIFSTLACI